ncbi:MAG: hypothetical protein K2L98_04775, partial [Bacilli bacterium]|nr:hypothetical protein [Bacilli bacterium]
MEKRNIKKIDLKDKLMYEMRKRNLIQKPEVSSVINYLLNKDIVSTFGKTEFETCLDRDFVDEIEITRIGDGLFITTVDGKYYQVQFRENGMDVYVVRTEDGKVDEISDTERVFDITLGKDNVINNLITSNEDEKYEHTHEFNNENLTFNYSCGPKDRNKAYSASITSLGAKFGPHEVVHYSRLTPPATKGASLLKKFKTSFREFKDAEEDINVFKRLGNAMKVVSGRKMENGDCITSIATSEALTELAYYCDYIFNI